MPTTQSMAETGAKSAATDLRILAGYDLGPSGDSWQDVAGTASVMLHSFAKSLDFEVSLSNDKKHLSFPVKRRASPTARIQFQRNRAIYRLLLNGETAFAHRMPDHTKFRCVTIRLGRYADDARIYSVAIRPTDDSGASSKPGKKGGDAPPKPMGPLTGGWIDQKSGVGFVLVDDGKTVQIEATKSRSLRRLTGILKRRDKEGEEKFLDGTLNATFEIEPDVVRVIRVTGIHEDQASLRLRCLDMPFWDRQGKFQGTRLENLALKRQ
ncbi:MAG: hypothetical protein IH987_05235 [Planctomycetes bacterium]|nr:hypothetical protein [Planctomycetota bacterium]